MRISYSWQAQAQSERDYHHELSDPSRPGKLGRIPRRYAVLRTIVSLFPTLDLPGDDVDENHEVIGVEVKNTVGTGEHVQDELVDGIGTATTREKGQ